MLTSFPINPDETTVIRNQNKGTTTFWAHFKRAGWVELALPPGGKVRVLARIPGVHVDVDDFRSAGLRLLDD